MNDNRDLLPRRSAGDETSPLTLPSPSRGEGIIFRLGALYGVGMGPGDPELLTLKALRILQTVPTIFTPVSRGGGPSLARTIAASYLDSGRQRMVELPIDMHAGEAGLAKQWEAAAQMVADSLAQGMDAAFITEGDPLLYSTFVHLADALGKLCPSAGIVIVPGISSMQAAAAAAGVPLAEHDQRIAILPTAYEGDGLRKALNSFDTVVLLKVGEGLDRVIDEIQASGASAVYVRRCGWPDEEIVHDLHALRGHPPDYFSLLIVRRSR